jgi:aminotransferase in exopolysaccharide biosynthesis
MISSQTSSSLADNVLAAIQSVAGFGPVSLHEPSFDGNELQYLKECIDSTYVSSVGKFVDKFEKDLTTYTGAKFAISVVNGTAALHIALKLAGVQSGDEVLLPALTFVATANAITYCGAIPHFADSEDATLGIDVLKLREYLNKTTSQESGKCINKITGRVIRALIPMHTFGHPSNIDGLLSIANDFNIILIEDAAESLGSFYSGQHTGTFGLLGTLSFNGNKTITTGGGGAILTNDEGLARRAKHLTTTAKLPHAWEFRHDEIGYNYRMPNINAALGCAQLEQLPSKLKAKRELFLRYQNAFKNLNGVKLFSEPMNCQSNYWLQTLLLDETESGYRDNVLLATNNSGIMTRPIWVLLNELEPFRSSPSMELATAHSLFRRIINIPSSPALSVGVKLLKKY